MRKKLLNYIKAAYPVLYVVTWEEARAEADLRSVTQELGYGLHTWSITEGLVDLATGSIVEAQDPIEILSEITQLPEKTVVCLKDYHAFLGDQNDPVNPIIARTIRDLARTFKARQQVLVLCAPILKLPPELEKEVTVIEQELPGQEEIGTVITGICDSANLDNPRGEDLELLLDSARGLTTSEAENALALSFVEIGGLDATIVAREKAQAVKKDGLLELWESAGSLEQIGGLDALKSWLMERRNAFSTRARDFGLPIPKGLLMVGLPGCGKSLTAKATASAWERPLLRLDAGRIYGGLVGESERNLRQAIQVAEAISPCVLWLDEIEKGFGGGRSGSTDGGTSARVFGSFLTWMEEKRSSVFVIATANDVAALPPELLRKGRFDELFFVDLPTPQERHGIFTIHLDKRGRRTEDFDLDLLSETADQFSGAEIEAAVISGMFMAFHAEQEVETEHILQAIRATTPLARTAREKITALREWAKTRARPATSDTSTPDFQITRKITASV